MLGIWCFCEHLRRKASLCFRGMYRVCNETREFPLPAFVGMCKAGDRSIEILFCCCVGRKCLQVCDFVMLVWKKLVGRLCAVFLEVWVVCEWLRRTWTFGFVEGNQCAMFSGPSLFGYKWLVLKNEKLPKWAFHFFKCPQMLDNMPSKYITTIWIGI